MISPTARSHREDLLAFLDASPSPFHAAAEAAQRLRAAGFVEVSASDAWPTGPGGRILRRGGAVLAWFEAPDTPAYAPFRIVGAHTDSPNLRLKPHPDDGTAGWRQVAVEIYGGTLLNTWLDRDLGLSGRLVLRDGTTTLVCIDEPLLRVPQLAIHLDRSVNDGLALDRQRHLHPVSGLGPVDHGAMRRRVAAAADVDPDAVVAADLMCHDLTPAGLLGVDREFLVSARLDNLISVHAGVAALVRAAEHPSTAAVPVLAAFDHEEVGSVSATGAGGTLLRSVLERSVAGRGGDVEARERALAGAFCVSADMTHAVHPNYAERHDPAHAPLPGRGPAIKTNTNQRYATDAESTAVFVAACERAGVPWQEFVSNNAMPCGSTIGPITAARLGVATVDVGVPGLSMHSARELCGADDPALLAAALTAFLTPDGSTPLTACPLTA